jgi:nitrogen-specific signal transduction histidine kinase
LAHEELLLGQIASICATAQQLRKRKTSDSSDLAQLILADAARLVDMLKQINVISPLAYNPGQPHAPQTGSQAAPQQASNDEAD